MNSNPHRFGLALLTLPLVRSLAARPANAKGCPEDHCCFGQERQAQEKGAEHHARIVRLERLKFEPPKLTKKAE
jgi:hypothetical protein